MFTLLDANGQVLASQGVASGEQVLALVKICPTGPQQNNTEEPVTSWVEERGDNKTHYIFIIKPVWIAETKGLCHSWQPV